MLHSTVTQRGQTTIPSEVRRALRIKPGDRLDYKMLDGSVNISVHPGLASLAGSLENNSGRSFATMKDIRAAAKAEMIRQFKG